MSHLLSIPHFGGYFASAVIIVAAMVDYLRQVLTVLKEARKNGSSN